MQTDLANARSSQPLLLLATRAVGVGRNHGSTVPARVASRRRGKPAARLTTTAALQDEHVRIFAVSDIHTDYDINMQWVQRLSAAQHRQDTLILAGDVSDDLRLLRQTLVSLAAAFRHVFFVPGNHDLWVRGSDTGRNGGALDSLQKLRLVLDLCRELGVHSSPQRLGAVWVVPLLSWHHQSFDREPDIPGVPRVSAWSIVDYSACRWPDSVPGASQPGSRELAGWFDGQNGGEADPALRGDCDVVSFSHFLPSQELLPEKRFLFYPNLAKAVGSDPLGQRVAALKPDIHIFGHTHFSWDATLQGTRHIQAPLCGPSERQRRLRSILTFEPEQHQHARSSLGRHHNKASMAVPGIDALRADWLPLLVYQSGQEAPGRDWQALKHGYMCPPLHAHWSSYYEAHQRDPANTELAPWIAPIYRRRRARAQAQAVPADVVDLP
ncbi:hypothetical protein WJX72_005956 [[Myrmecia] bisecta]|uniref:Calcineurin-like phosphoesterase domain-containing protein n=1 Tax=[Myrmecia] bisecta TaxID=41462 RepID=A0AAW1R6V7_9CHLO